MFCVSKIKIDKTAKFMLGLQIRQNENCLVMGEKALSVHPLSFFFTFLGAGKSNNAGFLGLSSLGVKGPFPADSAFFSSSLHSPVPPWCCVKAEASRKNLFCKEKHPGHTPLSSR